MEKAEQNRQKIYLQDDEKFINKKDSFEESTHQKNKCYNCGWGLPSDADICENCGEWLLKGKCNFCYSDVDEGQKFCSECGNPPTGIFCNSCGISSHFDFCSQCDIPLTEQAKEMIDLIEKSNEFQNLLKLNETQYLENIEISVDKDRELEKLKNYIAKFSKEKPKKKEEFKLSENSNQKIEQNLKSIQESKENIKKEKEKQILQQQKENNAMRLMEETRKKTFKSNQESRKFFGALKILLPVIVQKRIPLGWKCNAFGVVHDNPQGCSATESGGIWLFETRTEKSFKSTEI
jgi:hypothetical protein